MLKRFIRMRPAGFALILAGMGVLAIPQIGSAQVLYDGWGSNGFITPPITLGYSNIGVTLGTSSLISTKPQGGFWGPGTGNLITGEGQGPGGSNLSRLAEMQQATKIAMDLTLLSAQINGGSGNFTGFAQANVIVVQLFSNAVPSLPSGINVFAQRSFNTATDTDTSGQNATWSGVDGTRTVTFDLTTITATDPTDGQTKSVGAILLAHPDIQLAKFGFTEQTGGGSPVGPTNFFYDNVRLLGSGGQTLAVIGNFEPIPEPGSLILASLAIPPVIRAIRRRRAASTPA